MNWQNKEDEIKKIIDSYEFPYEEEDWFAAKKLIDRKALISRWKRRIAGFMLLFLLLLLWWQYPAKNEGVQSDTAAQANNPNKSERTMQNGGKNAASPKKNTTVSPGLTINTQTHKESANSPAVTSPLEVVQGPRQHTPQQAGGGHHNGNGGVITESSSAPLIVGQEENSSLPPVTEPGNTGIPQAAPSLQLSQFSFVTLPVPGADLLPLTDSVFEVQNSGVAAPTSSGNGHKRIYTPHSISAVVGTNYSRLLLGGGGNYIVSPWAGSYYSYYLSHCWQFSAGLGYTVMGARGLKKEFISTTQSFGLTRTEITISTRRLHYIEMPLLARYYVGSRGRINIIGGINISYLANTGNTITETTYTTLAGPGTPATSRANAYKNGINTWDVQLQLGAETRILPRWHIGFIANRSFFGVEKNNYYPNTTIERSTGLQLFLRYDIYRF